MKHRSTALPETPRVCGRSRALGTVFFQGIWTSAKKQDAFNQVTILSVNRHKIGGFA
jgi:hypothetical protein